MSVTPVASQVAHILKPLVGFPPNDNGEQEGTRPLGRRVLLNPQLLQDFHERLIQPNVFAWMGNFEDESCSGGR